MKLITQKSCNTVLITLNDFLKSNSGKNLFLLEEKISAVYMVIETLQKYKKMQAFGKINLRYI